MYVCELTVCTYMCKKQKGCTSLVRSVLGILYSVPGISGSAVPLCLCLADHSASDRATSIFCQSLADHSAPGSAISISVCARHYTQNQEVPI